jgi:hypothetical protein
MPRLPSPRVYALNRTVVRAWLAKEERTIAWLARRADIPEGTLYNLLREESPNIFGLHHAQALAEVMGVDPMSLVTTLPDSVLADAPAPESDRISA